MALATAVLAAFVAYLVVRDSGTDGAELEASAESPSTTQPSATTSPAPRRERTTTTATTTTISTTTSMTAPPPPTTAPARSTTTAAPSRTTAATAPAPPFEHSVATVTAGDLGGSWHPDMGCPAPEQLRAVTVSHWGYDGAVHSGTVVVAAVQVDRVVAALRAVFAARFPIERMTPVSAYGGDDEASMRANNTSAFNCRYVAGTTKLSEHGLGQAIDINPLVNPYVKGSSVDPPEGARYADRSRTDPGMIHTDDAVVRAFAAQGWKWGGYWSGGKDYQHFSAGGG